MDDVYKLILFLFIILFEFYMLRNVDISFHYPDFVVSHLFGYNDVFYIGAKGILSQKELGSRIVDKSYDTLTVIKDTFNNQKTRSSSSASSFVLSLLSVVKKYLKSDPLPRRYTSEYQSDPNYLKNVLARSNYSLSGFATLETNRMVL